MRIILTGPSRVTDPARSGVLIFLDAIQWCCVYYTHRASKNATICACIYLVWQVESVLWCESKTHFPVVRQTTKIHLISQESRVPRIAGHRRYAGSNVRAVTQCLLIFGHQLSGRSLRCRSQRRFQRRGAFSHPGKQDREIGVFCEWRVCCDSPQNVCHWLIDSVWLVVLVLKAPHPPWTLFFG
jgi:hypothetical protein